MENRDLISVLESIQYERGLTKDSLLEGIREALYFAYKKRYSRPPRDLQVVLDEKKGEFKVFVKKLVVEKAKKGAVELSLEDAQKINPEAKTGDEVELEVNPLDLSRIAASTGKYVMMQQIVEKEKDRLYEEFKKKEGELVSGTIRYKTDRFILIDLGKLEGILPDRESFLNRDYRQGERILAYVVRVTRESRGPHIVLSQTHPNFLRRLFEMEVPEIAEGIVEIKQIKRDAGRRAKVVVESKDGKIDPVGACVGLRGSRIKAILREMGKERIDIIKYSLDPVEFIKNALKPAQVQEVKMDEKRKEVKVIVTDDQLSLAIGANGENVKLAAKLTGWQIDVRSLGQIEKEEALLHDLPGIGEKTLTSLREHGFLTLKDIVRGGFEKLTEVEGIGPKLAEKMLKKAQEKLD
ncbi:transcription termination/antitermination protein NusA [Candidatus Aerophobetes bacterium]|nr:transcription termination/antitermination protein NusA [Candidatus Aerophobetes bacterium]